jgi:hypothetical protein
MYFLAQFNVKYYMFNKKRVAALLILVLICAITLIIAAMQKDVASDEQSQMTVLNVWQVDSFEGGKGHVRSIYKIKQTTALKTKTVT